jgi:hypothetical protein
MRRKFQSWIAKISVVVALVVSSVVLAQEVSTQPLKGTDFSKYHTYKWLTNVGSGPQPNPMVDAQIKRAIDSQLASKGLTKTDSLAPASLLVGYQAAIDQQTQWNSYVDFQYSQQQSSIIDVGTLVLDMYDPAAKQLVWTGRATKALDPSASQEKRQENLDKAMERLLKDFPPKNR